MENIKIISTNKKDTNIKEFLLQNGLTATLIKKVKYGGVSINGITVTMRAVVKPGDEVLIILPDDISEGIPPIDMPLDIVYEDEYMLAIKISHNSVCKCGE